jgi:hypothetical protein
MSLTSTSITTASTTLFAGGTGRVLEICNLSATDPIFVKADTTTAVVTATNGRRIPSLGVWEIFASQWGTSQFPAMTAIATGNACTVSVQLLGGSNPA